MTTFAIYTYKFRDVENTGIFLGQEDDSFPLPTLKDKQDFVQKIFHDDLHGGRPFECCLIEENADTQSNHKITKKTPFECKVLWEKYGLIVLMISNPYKKVTYHENFKKYKRKDEPWCHVLIDNRLGREFVAIEMNKSAFPNIDKVAAILESSLRKRLTPHKVTIDIKNQYTPDAFWQVVDKYQSWGFQEVAFRFAVPNNPWAAQLIGQTNEAARAMNAKPTAIFSSHDNLPIILDKSNQELCNYIEACSMQGEDIEIKVIGMRSRIHIKKIKDKYVFKQMSENTFRYLLQEDPQLFDENFDALAAFVSQIQTSKEQLNNQSPQN